MTIQTTVARVLPRNATGWAQQSLPFLVLAACYPFLANHLAAVTPADIGRALGSVPTVNWLVAILATGASFWAVGRYDARFHGWLDTGLAPATAARAGAAAIAIAQTVGFGLVSGTVVRWKLLPGLDLVRTARLTAFVSVTFMAALAIVVSATVWLLGRPEGAPGWIGWLGLAVAVLAVAGSLWQPRRLPVRVPPLPLLAAILGYAVLDTIFAGIAFWALLPPDSGATLALILPAFLIALGAGLVSGTPGGVGPFEITLIGLLPVVPETTLVPAILAFRALYYAVPAALAALWLIAARGTGSVPATVRAPEDLDAALAHAPRAEAGLLRLGELRLLSDDRVALAVGATGQALVTMGDPLAAHEPGAALSALRRAAGRTGRIPALYKCGSRIAARARQEGWSVLAIAREAWLDPRGHGHEGAARRQLRRKLKSARTAGLETVEARGPLPLDEMAALARAWADRHGGERGFSMGRFEGAYVSAQRVYLARSGDRLVGFATLHVGAREWTVDLMRTAANAPDGTMHALIDHAIADAAALGCPRFSLAAVPLDWSGPAWLDPLWARLRCDGLRQFKAAFGPHYETLYAASPTRFGLALALADVAWRIRHPEPLDEARVAGGSRSL